MAWRNKFRKKSQYRSGLEKDIAEDLKERGIEFGFESVHLQYRKRVNSGECDACGHGKVSQRRNYTPDFELSLGGRKIYIESKGNFPPADRAKMLAVKEAHPLLDIRLLFAANNKLQKGKDARYSDWADKHGFTYAIGRAVPEAWLQSPTGDGQVQSVPEGEPKVVKRRSKKGGPARRSARRGSL